MDKCISVLIVEDEEHIRKVLKYNLQLDGFKVYLAHDGATALKMVYDEKPDVILLDWIMPHTDGLTVLSELKRDASTKNIPVFMLTAKDMFADVKKAIDIGADDYITKPFDPMRLSKIIMQKMEKCKSRACHS